MNGIITKTYWPLAALFAALLMAIIYGWCGWKQGYRSGYIDGLMQQYKTQAQEE